MPLVRITLRKGKSPEFLAAASAAVHEALVTQANVPADDQFHVIEEVEPGRIIANRTYLGANRSENVMFIQITLNEGRSVDVKKALYTDIARRLSKSIDVRSDDVLISLIEVSKVNWSFAFGAMSYPPE